MPITLLYSEPLCSGPAGREGASHSWFEAVPWRQAFDASRRFDRPSSLPFDHEQGMNAPFRLSASGAFHNVIQQKACGACTSNHQSCADPFQRSSPMRCHPSLRHGLLVLSLSVAVVPAWAGDDCDAPLSHWQSRDAVRQMAAAKGWQIQRLKIDDGCYEIRGTDAQGRAFKAKLDPETLKVLKMKQGNHPHDRARDRGHDGVRPPPPDVAPASTPGMAPRRQIE
jgi:hypothetical protein